MSTQTQIAINLALNCLWEDAIIANLAVLEANPSDIATLNRLGKAYAAIGDKDSAKKMYQKVLDFDKYNSVALKNLKLLSIAGSNIPTTDLVKEDFIETPGITKTTQLIKLADKQTLLSLCCKQELNFKPKGHLISLITNSKTYIGTLPDDLSHKINIFLKKGYCYQVCLKSASDKNASIFIRELKRPTKKNLLPTFSKGTRI